MQVDYAARKWPGITWLLDHMSYPYPAGDLSAGVRDRKRFFCAIF